MYSNLFCNKIKCLVNHMYNDVLVISGQNSLRGSLKIKWPLFNISKNKSQRGRIEFKQREADRERYRERQREREVGR